MAVKEDYLNYILDQLSEFGKVEVKKMFGGIGLFHEGLMFGKIGGETFRLKVDDSNKPKYEAKGMKPFHSEKKKKGMPYWEVPLEILKDRIQLKEWAKESYQIAINSKK